MNQPDAKQATPLRYDRLRYLSLFVGCMLITWILYVRKPDAFLNPQFWAEDGTVFFLTAYRDGIAALFQPYSGYLHLLPRIIAWVADALPYRWTPAIYNLAGLIGTWAVVAMLHSPRLRLPFPLGYSMVLVLVPHMTGEIFVNLTNLQWSLSLLLLLCVLQEGAKTMAGRILDSSILVLAGLSTPLIVLVVPIQLYRSLRNSTLALLVQAGLTATIAAVQALIFWRHPTYFPPHPEHTSSAWIELLGWKTFGTFFLAIDDPYEIQPILLSGLGLALLGWIVWQATIDDLGQRFLSPALFFAVSSTALAFYKYREAANLLVPPAAAARYFYILWVVLTWCLLTHLLKGKLWVRVVSATLLGLILYSSLTSVFRSPPLIDYHWKEYSESVQMEEPVEVPINPRGWSLRLNSPDA